MGLILYQCKKTDEDLQKLMFKHYSCPKGFVGRSLCYKIIYNDIFYGCIVGGSATLYLPGRNIFFSITKEEIKHIVNNVFYHIEKVDGHYPLRNFTTYVLIQWMKKIQIDWYEKYRDYVYGFESLVELPRTGELYKRAGWSLIGQTKGYTCKRISGQSTDSWSGRRIWDTKNLHPKLVYAFKI